MVACCSACSPWRWRTQVSNWLPTQEPASHLARTIYAAIAILVPLNLAALSLLKERGLASRWGARRMGAILLQAGVVMILATGQPDGA